MWFLRRAWNGRRASQGGGKAPVSDPDDPQHRALAKLWRRVGDAAAELLKPCLSAKSIALIDALVDELCARDALEALLVAEEVADERELVVDAMRDAYDMW